MASEGTDTFQVPPKARHLWAYCFVNTYCMQNGENWQVGDAKGVPALGILAVTSCFPQVPHSTRG